MKIVKQAVELLWASPDIEKNIELAARTCYKSEDKITDDSAKALIRALRKSGHHAMLEFGVVCFRVTTDKGITHEIVRHRLASYAQESTRWCNYSGNKFGNEIAVIEPPGLSSNQMSTWLDACEDAEHDYLKMLEQGCKPQIARSVLPHCLKTEIVMMMNTRELRHFVKLRGAKDAHPQIQELAKMMLNILKTLAPTLYEDLEL